MKSLGKRIKSHKYYDIALHWGKLVTITGSSQLVVQATGALSGILIIRFLPIEEYALYTIANTMLGTMTILSDSGIANGVMAEGGKVWKDKSQLGKVLQTGLDLRRKFGLVSLLVAIPILVYLLRDHGAGWLSVVLITMGLIPAFYANLSDAMLAVAPRLHQDIKPLQTNYLQVGIGRLLLNGLFVFIFPFTFIALFANSIPRLYGNYRLRKISSKFLNIDEKPDKQVRKEIIVSVKRTMPLVIYYVISGQLAIWLISFFGSTASISKLGAMGRLAMVFTIVISLFSTLVVPRFSRMKESRGRLRMIFLAVQLLTLVLSSAMVFGVFLFSDPILWVLGEDYYGLNYELLLVAIANGLNLMIGVCSQLTVGRGWYLKPMYLISLNFISTLISIAFLNLETLRGVLYFNIIVAAVHYGLMFVYGNMMINKSKKGVDNGEAALAEKEL